MAKQTTPQTAYARAVVSYVSATVKAGAGLWAALIDCVKAGGIEAARAGQADAGEQLKRTLGDAWASSDEYKSYRAVAAYISVLNKALEKGATLEGLTKGAAEKLAYAKPAPAPAPTNDNDNDNEGADEKGKGSKADAKKPVTVAPTLSEPEQVAKALEILQRDAALRIKHAPLLASLAAMATAEAAQQEARRKAAAIKGAATRAAKGKGTPAQVAAATLAAVEAVAA